MTLFTGLDLVALIRQWSASVPLVPRPTRQVGTDEITEMERAVALFRTWDASGRGGLHRKAVIGQFNAVAENLHGPGSLRESDRERMFGVAAELAQLAGWMTFDSGLHVPAQRYFLFAVETSQQACNYDLAAKIVGDMAQLSKFLGHNDDCLAMLRTALAVLPRGANPLVRSELSAHQACAHARYGPPDASHARRSVDASLEAFEEADASARTNWLLYMDRSEVNSLAASAYMLLAQNESDRTRAVRHAARAEHYARQANEHRPGRRVRRSASHKMSPLRPPPWDTTPCAWRRASVQHPRSRDSVIWGGLSACTMPTSVR